MQFIIKLVIHCCVCLQIAPAVRDRCVNLIQTMQAHSKKQLDVNAKLRALWCAPDAVTRLKAVTAVEPELLNSLKGIGLKGELEAGADGEHVGDDNKSEYSAVSNLSSASYLSTATSKSGASSVSILSNLSLSSDSQRSTSSGASKGKAFSIQGIDHALLSRGSADDAAPNAGKGKKAKTSRQLSDKQAKKRDRRQRGIGPDVCGLKNECQLCHEMWGLAQSLRSISVEAAELCEVLTLLGGSSRIDGIPSELIESSLLTTVATSSSSGSSSGAIVVSDVSLAALVQKAVDSYALHFRNNSVPIGPAYTSQWLTKKHMSVMGRFQDSAQFLTQASAVTEVAIDVLSVAHAHANSVSKQQQELDGSTQDASVDDGAKKNWWQVVADGITNWQKLRKLNLALENCL
jgi:hypothetical protein